MSAALTTTVRAPTWILTYQGVAITADITAMVEEIVYDNHEEHLSDEIQVMLDDSLYRWQGPWSPHFGDLVTLQIGYAGGQLLACGTFGVDEIELDGPPDIFHLRALAAGPKAGIRTPTSARFEN